jgi:hypothetical protein
VTKGDRASFQTSTCSRPPFPTTNIFIGLDPSLARGELSSLIRRQKSIPVRSAKRRGIAAAVV